jgi:hypothetical protein
MQARERLKQFQGRLVADRLLYVVLILGADALYCDSVQTLIFVQCCCLHCDPTEVERRFGGGLISSATVNNSSTNT